jgi:predicted phosphodiesterase
MKRILVVSDLHVGSKWGLTSKKDNSVQRRLFGWWREMVDETGSVDACIVNGDICDGLNRKEEGEGIEIDAKDQILEAVDLLERVDCKKFYGTQGTGYHTKKNPSMDWAVIHSLKGVFDTELALTIEKTRFHVAHKIGVSGSGQMYHGTPISKEMMVASLNREQMGKFDVILRGHAHYFFYTGSKSTLAVIGPCWKGRDPYASANSLKWNPDIGWMLFEVDGDSYSWEHHIKKLDQSELFTEQRL